MLNDLDIIQKTFPGEMDTLIVYALGDVHAGSPQFNERAIQKKIEIIQNDPNGVVCLCGDLGGYALKNEYEIPAPPELQYLELSAYRDGKHRHHHKIMSYHTIQIR